MKKIDIHLHCLGDERVPMANSRVPSRSDLLNGIFPQTQTERGILMATPPDPLRADVSAYREANAAVRALAKADPGRFSWMCCFDPRAPELADEVLYDELRRCQSEGAVGFGEVCAPLWIDAPEMQRVYACLQELRMPLLMHMAPQPMAGYGVADEPGLPRLERMLKAYPDLVFIGHSQIFWSELSADCPSELRAAFPSGRVTPGRVATLMEQYPNLCADLSAMSGFNALARDLKYTVSFMDRFQDRLMYGSDCLLPRFGIHTDTLLDSLVELGLLDAEAGDKICRRNARRLFDL